MTQSKKQSAMKAYTRRNGSTIKFNLLVKLPLFMLGLAIAGAGIFAIMVMIMYPKMPSMDELRNYQPKLPLQVYSSDGVLLGQFGQEHRIFVSFKNTPPLLIKAILAAEDERFYQHGGVDYIGVVRAVLGNVLLFHKQSGASTITMQVARNFFLSAQKTYARKFNEVLLAYKMESSLTKDQILELYINQIYLGQRAYGFAEAAITYFGKPLDKLTIAEYAVLAGLPKAPSAFNPVVNKKRSHDREVYILNRMHTLDFITDAEYDAAVKQKISVVHGSAKDATDAGGYVSEMVRQMLYEKYGESIYTAGYKVVTTVDSKMQLAAYVALRNGVINYDSTYGYKGAEDQLDVHNASLSSDSPNDAINDQVLLTDFESITDFGDLQAAIVLDSNKGGIRARLRNGNDVEFHGDKQLRFVKKYLTGGGKRQIKHGSLIRVRNINGVWSISQIPEAEGAIVALNPNDGAIKALVGGFDFTKNKYNHVTQAMRQPGSSFKPLIYSAALDKGYNADTIIDDSQICFATGGENNGQWCPKNDGDEGFFGDVTFRWALTKSLNVSTVKIINQITPEYTIDYLTRFGFNKDQFHPYLTLALGVDGVTPLQMAVAYAVFANGGYVVTPYLINTIADNNGNILAKTEPTDIKLNRPTIDQRNAYIMNSILQDVVRYGTGSRVYHDLQRDDVAGKTGTTSENKDTWFDGYTPNLVAITWVGYDQPKSLGANAYGASVALPIWLDFMKSALVGMPQMQSTMPPGIEVKHNATSQGNDEYVYISGFTPHVASEPAEVVTDVKDKTSTASEPTAADKNKTSDSIDDLIDRVNSNDL
jgi:penicillin-binding protein 1A